MHSNTRAGMIDAPVPPEEGEEEDGEEDDDTGGGFGGIGDIIVFVVVFVVFGRCVVSRILARRCLGFVLIKNPKL